MALATLERTPGWKVLAPEVRRALTALLSGTANPRSQRAAPVAMRQPRRPGWETASPQAQAKALAELLTHPEITPPQMKTEDMPVPRKSAGHSLTQPVPEPGHQFHGAVADAETRTLLIGDQQIPVVAPAGTDLARVADLVSKLPPELRGQLTSISVNPVPNPDDEYWTKVYGQPVLAGMSCGAQGLLTIYPHGLEQSDDVLIRNLAHETGHTLSMRWWGGGNVSSPEWSRWKDAMAADVIAPSRYATASPAEDVAESIATYVMTRGTKAFDEYRAMMPARFAVLDEMLSRRAQPSQPS
ncbi:MAG TPA: hypothetical protein VND93_26155 [Myxococcales bacterium]|nr:hypothetical protein [Myxococcales bacterium]